MVAENWKMTNDNLAPDSEINLDKVATYLKTWDLWERADGEVRFPSVGADPETDKHNKDIAESLSKTADSRWKLMVEKEREVVKALLDDDHAWDHLRKIRVDPEALRKVINSRFKDLFGDKP